MSTHSTFAGCDLASEGTAQGKRTRFFTPLRVCGRVALDVLGARSVVARACAVGALSTAAAMTLLPSANAAAAAGPAAPASPSAAQFCAKLAVPKVSAALGTAVALYQAVFRQGALECIYFGKVEVVISKHAGLPAADVASRTRAEQFLASESPKGVKLTFTSLPSVGPTAFSWSYQLNGGKLFAVADNKGTTGYGALIGGAPSLINTTKDLPELEKLLAFDISA
jgi:hypothetical protein